MTVHNLIGFSPLPSQVDCVFKASLESFWYNFSPCLYVWVHPKGKKSDAPWGPEKGGNLGIDVYAFKSSAIRSQQEEISLLCHQQTLLRWSRISHNYLENTARDPAFKMESTLVWKSHVDAVWQSDIRRHQSHVIAPNTELVSERVQYCLSFEAPSSLDQWHLRRLGTPGVLSLHCFFVICESPQCKSHVFMLQQRGRADSASQHLAPSHRHSLLGHSQQDTGLCVTFPKTVPFAGRVPATLTLA